MRSVFWRHICDIYMYIYIQREKDKANRRFIVIPLAVVLDVFVENHRVSVFSAEIPLTQLVPLIVCEECLQHGCKNGNRFKQGLPQDSFLCASICKTASVTACESS